MSGPLRPTGPRKLALEPLERRDTPATVAVADTYNIGTAQVLTVPVTTGVLANDFNTVQPGAVLVSQLLAGPNFTNTQTPLPANSLFLNPNGSFTFISPSNVTPDAGPVVFTYRATAPNGEFADAVVTINLQETRVRLIATGADAGGSPEVRVYTAGTSVLRNTFTPYESAFTGGVRVAVGDVNSDGVDDIITVPQNGGSVRLRVFSGVDGNPLVDRFVFDPAFRGGGYVAVGDINGDGRQDIVVGAGEGGGPRVTVLTYFVGAAQNTATVADFFAYDSAVRSGVRVAAGSLNGFGADSIVTTPGVGGGPQVNVFAGSKVAGKAFVAPSFSFFAGSSDNRDGIYVTTGNLSGTGARDIIIGTGAGASTVSVYDGRTGGLTRQFTVAQDQTVTGGGTPGGGGTFNFTAPSGTLLSPTTAPSSLVPGATSGGLAAAASGGVRVGTVDFDGDGTDEFLAASGPGNSPRVRVLSAKNQTEITSIFPYPSTFLGGVNVAGSR